MENFLYILAGFFVGIAVLVTIKKYEKDNKEYGVLKLPLAIFLVGLSVGGFVYMRVRVDSVGFFILTLSSLMICIWLLLTTSYMDQRCGFFQLGVLLIAGCLELILLITALILGWVRLSSFCMVVSLLICLILFICHRVGEFSFGDLCIFYTCQCVYLIVCKEMNIYLVANIISFSVTLLTYLVRNLFRLKKVLGEKKRLPFTMYIASGVFVALMAIL